MPKEKGEKMAVTIWIDKETINRIDKIAENVNLTRSKLISNIVEANVLEVEAFNKTGLLKAMSWVMDLKERAIKSKEKIKA